MKLQQDMYDELSLGHLAAIGRFTVDGEYPNGYDTPLAPIEREHWIEFRPQILLAIDQGNRVGYSFNGKETRIL